MTYDRSHHQVLAALNHGAYTFRSFDAADWRAMAEECLRRADKVTCVDCGKDVGMGKLADCDPEHRVGRGGRYSCGQTAANAPLGPDDGCGCAGCRARIGCLVNPRKGI